MAKSKETPSNQTINSRPALSPEAEEQECIALAMKLVKERLKNGTASSQETTHFLKQASMKNQLEMEKLRQENELTKAKTEQIASSERSEQIYKDAIEAFRTYSGGGSTDDH